MSSIIDAIGNEDRDIHGIEAVDALHPNEPRTLTPREQKTNHAALQALDTLDHPHSSDRLRADRVSSDPNLALEGVRAASRYESKAVRQLEEADKQTRQRLDLIDKLLDLSTELTKLGDKDKMEIPEKMKEILHDLKERGIELLKEIDVIKQDHKTVSKEQVVEMKSLIGGRIDKTRTEVQQFFTRMQQTMQDLSSVNASAKQLINEHGQLNRTISRNMRAGA